MATIEPESFEGSLEESPESPDLDVETEVLNVPLVGRMIATLQNLGTTVTEATMVSNRSDNVILVDVLTKTNDRVLDPTEMIPESFVETTMNSGPIRAALEATADLLETIVPSADSLTVNETRPESNPRNEMFTEPFDESDNAPAIVVESAKEIVETLRPDPEKPIDVQEGTSNFSYALLGLFIGVSAIVGRAVLSSMTSSGPM